MPQLRSGSWLNDNREVYAVYVMVDTVPTGAQIMVNVEQVESLEQIDPVITKLVMKSGVDHDISGTIQDFIDQTLV